MSNTQDLSLLGSTLTSDGNGADVTGSVTADGLTVDGSAVINQYLTLKTTDDQVNGWVLYTGITDKLEFNYNGAGNAEVVIDSTGNVGIGTTSPPEGFAIGATSSVAGFSIGSADTQVFLRYNNYFSGTAQVSDATKGTASISLGRGSDGVITFNTAAAGAGVPTEAMRIDARGVVGINAVPEAWDAAFSSVLQVGAMSVLTSGGDNARIFGNAYYDGGATYKRINTGYAESYEQTTGEHRWYNAASGAADSTFTWVESMRIDGAGNLLVAGTNTNPVGNNVVGHALTSDGRVQHSTTGDTVLKTNQTTDGVIAQFRVAGAPVGSIGTTVGLLGIGSGDAILAFDGTGNAMYPMSSQTGGASNGDLDFGSNLRRFKDLYLSNNISLSNATTSAFLQVSTDILQFGTSSNDPLAFYANNVERMRITNGGALQLADVNSPNDLNCSIFSNNDVLELEAFGTNGEIAFSTGSSVTEHMRIDSNGTVKISHADTASEGLRVIQTTAGRTSGGALALIYDDQGGTTQPTFVVQQNGTGDILQLFDGAAQVVTVKDGGNVGIGVTNPDTKLEVRNPTQATDTVNTLLTQRWSRAQTASVKWGNSMDLLLGSYESGTINSRTRVDFKLADGATDDPDTTVMTLQGNGNVGIGTDTPAVKLDVTTTAASRIATFWDAGSDGTAMSNGAAVLGISRISDGVTALHGPVFEVGRDNSTSTSYNVDQTLFSVHSDKIIAGNNIEFADGKGIDFSASSNALGMTSELLSDYEEGTWTPVVSTSVGTLGAVSGETGTYTRIGRQVTLWWNFNITDLGTGSGVVFISNASKPFSHSTSISYPIGINRPRSGTSSICELDTTGAIYMYGSTIGPSFHTGSITYNVA